MSFNELEKAFDDKNTMSISIIGVLALALYTLVSFDFLVNDKNLKI
jgi:hypothetical protein